MVLSESEKKEIHTTHMMNIAGLRQIAMLNRKLALRDHPVPDGYSLIKVNEHHRLRKDVDLYLDLRHGWLPVGDGLAFVPAERMLFGTVCKPN